MCNSRVRWVVLILVSVLLASACGGSDGTPEAAPTETADDPGTVADGSDLSLDDDDQNDATADVIVSGDEPQTLDDYLGVNVFTPDPQERAATYVRQEQKVQESIARCMAREGFEYVPVEPVTDDFGLVDPADVEHARIFGFGVSTQFDETESSSSDDDWVDPNSEIVESLSDSERDAYDLALHGTIFVRDRSGLEGNGAGSTDDADRAAEVEGANGDGCSGQAIAEVYALEELQGLLAQLDLESLNERIEADPRTVASLSGWSECMAELGYDYENLEALVDTIYVDLEVRFSEIVGDGGGFVDPFQGMSREEINEIFESLSPEELDAFYAQAEQAARAAIDREALAALQAEERALAVANAECSEGLYEQLTEVYREYEAELVKENRTLLEEYRERREN